MVHGQTQGSGQQQKCRSGDLSGTATSWPAASGSPSTDSELQQASAKIQRLKASSSGGGSSGGGSSGGGGQPTASGSCQLAEAYLRRARVHQAAGQLHHALFDTEEALALNPSSAEAAAFAAALRQALNAQHDAAGSQPGQEDSDEDPW